MIEWRLVLALLLGSAFCSTAALAQEPACAAVPEAGRSCVDILLVEPSLNGLGRTGISGFGADNEPGNDASATNHIIRSLDVLIYEVRYRVLHQAAGDTRIRFTLPAAMEFANAANPDFAGAAIPDFCGAGSFISAQQLNCELGLVNDGTTRNVTVLARPRFGTADGAILLPQAEISASNQQSTGPVSRTGYQDPISAADLSCDETRNGSTVSMFPCGDIVSAAPRFDLEFSGYASTNLLDRGARGPQINQPALASTITTVVGGAPGRRGYTMAFPIAIALPGDGVGGAPVSGVAPIVLTQRLRNSDGLAGFGELVGCGLNGNSDSPPTGTAMPAGWAVGAAATNLRAVFHPFGRIGLAGSSAENSVVDSGVLSCTQAVAGGDITLTLTPAERTFNPDSFPTRQVDGQVVPRKYVFVGLVAVFYPADPVLTPAEGGTGDGSVSVRHDLGVLTQGNLMALRINGTDEPDAAAINDGFGGVQTYDDDNNNFSLVTLDGGGSIYEKYWRNPRLDNFSAASLFCLRDTNDPVCRHGHVFPGSNIQSEFKFNNLRFGARDNAQFCDEWDSARTLLRRPFDPFADPLEMPTAGALYLDLGGLNGIPAVLNAAGFSVEVSTTPGNIPNIDWDSVEPARTNARSQLSAPECSSGNWISASLPAQLEEGRHLVQLPASLESPPGSGRYPGIQRIRIRAKQLPPFVSLGLRGSYEVVANASSARLPNRTAFRFGNEQVWTYAENDHAIVRTVDTSIAISASANLSTGASGPLSSIGFGEIVETTIFATFNSGDASPVPSSFPLVVKSFLPPGLDYIGGSAEPALFTAPYTGINPQTLQTATVLEWLIPGLIPGNGVPPIKYHSQLNFSAANNSVIHTTGTVEHALDPGPLFIEPISSSSEDRLAFYDLVAQVSVGLLVTKATDTPFIELGGAARWNLFYGNSTGSPFAVVRIIDVLPFDGDGVNTSNAFTGGFSGGSVAPLLPGEYALYHSNTAPLDINRNPNCVSNGGSIADGQGVCPGVGALWTLSTDGLLPPGVTAMRIDDGNGLPANSGQTVQLELNTSGNRAGDVYENSFTAVAPGESLVLSSARSEVRLPSGEIQGAVYADVDDSLTLSSADYGIGGVTVTLTGSDTLGNALEITTTTVSAAAVFSIENSVRVNGGAAETVVCNTRLRRGQYLFCQLPSAGQNGYSIAETQPAGFLDREDNLGSLTSGASAGTAGNDVFLAVRASNNLNTGAGELGSGYNFGEYPLFAGVSGRVYEEASVPANLQDDDAEDPGITTAVSLDCSPTYQGNATQVTADQGRYSFAEVPVGAVCTIREVQPAGYINAYNTRGVGATGDTGSSGSGDSSITLSVPAVGSAGNNFAEFLLTDTTSQISCGPSNPQPGAAAFCVATCTNHGPAHAIDMSCNIVNSAALPGALLSGCQTQSSVDVGRALLCRVDFSMPLTGSVQVAAGSGARNDVNGGADPRQGNNPSSAVLGVPAVVAVPLSTTWLMVMLLLLGSSALPWLRNR